MSDDEFDLPDSETDNVSVGSNRRIILLDEEKLPTEKKVKLHQFKRKYVKTSWVWKYFETDQNGKYNVCQVLIMNLRNEEVLCGRRFLNDGATGNMANHLRGKHNIQEKINKVIL
jgi:hypothetical protein